MRRDPVDIHRFAVAAVLAAAAFVAFPEIDLWAAALFWRPEAGFWLGGSAYAQAWYEAVPIVRNAIVIPVGGVLLIVWAIRRKLPLGIPPRGFVLVIGTLLLGSGLLVNEVLKNRWDRPRPREIERFGGTMEFVPAFDPTGACDDNCSFVSGHAAFVFAGYALAILAHRRRAAILGVTVLGAMAGAGRMMQGGHFLSDIVFAGVFLFLVAWGLHRALFRRSAGADDG